MAGSSPVVVTRSTITHVIYGRDAERSHLADVVEAARAGTSSALVVRGAAGSGKSALLDDLATHAGMRTLRTLGVETESELAFAGLRQMLDPLLVGLDGLTPARRTALASALGLGDARGASDPFLIAAAVLDLIAAAAEQEPLLAIADDAHWLDGASQDALLFVARRLEGEGVALIFGAGDGDARSFEAPGVPRLELGGLDAAAACALIEQRSGTAPRPRSPPGSPPRPAGIRSRSPTGGGARARGAARRGHAAGSAPARARRRSGVPRARPAPSLSPRARCCCSSALEPAADLASLMRAGAGRDDLERGRARGTRAPRVRGRGLRPPARALGHRGRSDGRLSAGAPTWPSRRRSRRRRANAGRGMRPRPRSRRTRTSPTSSSCSRCARSSARAMPPPRPR